MTLFDLTLYSIDLRQMPGFPKGGFSIQEMSPGVNIIYGPNGSGKTTLARAICKILHPSGPPHEERSLFASLRVGEDDVTIDVDHGRVKCQREGVDIDLPPLTLANLPDRYVLALPDLMNAENGGDLAAQIVRESAGGYDLNDVRDELKFRAKPRSKGKINEAWLAAKRSVDAALDEQNELSDQENQLLELREKCEGAVRAVEELGWIEKSLEWHDADSRRQDNERSLQEFPAGVGKLHGSEMEDIKGLRVAYLDLESEQQSNDRDHQRAMRERESLELPRDGIPSQIVHELRLKSQRVTQLDTALEGHFRAMRRAETEFENARQQLGENEVPERVRVINLEEINNLFDFVSRWEEHENEYRSVKGLERWLNAEFESFEVEDLQEGIKLLRQARVEVMRPREGQGTRTPWIVGAVLCGVIGVVFSLLVHPSWLCVLPLAAGLLIWAFLPRKTNDRLRLIQQDFKGLGLAELAVWIETSIVQRLRETEQQWQKQTVAEERKKQWESLKPNREKLERDRQELTGERDAWQERLGLNESILDARAYLLARRLHDFQVLSRGRDGTKAELNETQKQRESLLRQMNEVFRTYNLPTCADAEKASATVETLDECREAYSVASRVVQSCEAERPAIEDRIQDIRKQLTTLYTEVGVTEDDDATLQRWLEQRDSYLALQDKSEKANTECELKLLALGDQAGLIHGSREELQQKRDSLRSVARTRDALNDQIVAITTRVEEAKKRTDLEAALARQGQAEDQLRHQRQEDQEALVGDLLLNHLAEWEHGEKRPKILQRAEKLFAGITHGRYRLLVKGGDSPSFRALDTDRDVGLELDELSSGTRLQLLLAVRVAFLEQQESKWKIPLILDETLANSDERRAELIIDAAIKLCREGRQIFYLTAQHDEVAKWQTMLKSRSDIPSRLIDLAELRGFSETERVTAIPTEATPETVVPAPGDSQRYEYGKKLRVPAIDPQAEISALHLWYVVDDVEILYRLLQNGINHWGQLVTLLECDGIDWLTSDMAVVRTAQALSSVVHRAIDCWRVGRGRPVDRGVLIRSDCVTDKFMDAVADLADDCDGDARKLLQGMERGVVKGFLAKKRHQLVEYLQDEEYLDERTVLTREEIVAQIRTGVFKYLDEGLICLGRIEEMVDCVIHHEIAVTRSPVADAS